MQIRSSCLAKMNQLKHKQQQDRFYKYRHKWRKRIEYQYHESDECDLNTNCSNCDIEPKHRSFKMSISNSNCYCHNHHHLTKSNQIIDFKCAHKNLILSSIILMTLIITKCESFCPFKCNCNDQSLSANCTQVPSISSVPMTLNPLLKSLTLNQLPIYDLSDSLTIYRQLEYLNLNSNQLRQIKYENFNFKSITSSINIRHEHEHMNQLKGSKEQQKQQLVERQEQLAKHIKSVIERSDDSSSSHSVIGSESDEIRFHLRELHLANNRIESLGNIQESDLIEAPTQTDTQQSSSPLRRFKSGELERLAPFLGLTRLKSLDLSGNRLRFLHQHALLGLVRLRQLDLSRNGLEFISDFAFVGLIELRELKLNHNHLSNQLISLGRSFCRAPMIELKKLELSDNQPISSQNSRLNNVLMSHISTTLDQHQHQHQQQQQQQHQMTILPSRTFICSPKLSSLSLNGIRLRYIQMNAFDNLNQLEMLNLSRNPLEQVPTEALSNLDTGLSLSLRHLDLSDTLIEYVNAQSFGSLRVLERLTMNSMPRLVSFDLASFYYANIDYGNGIGIGNAVNVNDKNKSYINTQDVLMMMINKSNISNNDYAYRDKQLVTNETPESESRYLNTKSDSSSSSSSILNFIFGSTSATKTKHTDHDHDDSNSIRLTSTRSSNVPANKIINHNSNSNNNNDNRDLQFINDHLIELELRFNPRLQSFHSSLINRIIYPNVANESIDFTQQQQTNAQLMMTTSQFENIEASQTKTRVKFTKLRLLDLHGARELLELPLDSMIDLESLNEPLRLDLTYAGRLKCSLCSMSWLFDVARQQRLLQASSVPSNRLVNGLWSPVPLFPSQSLFSETNQGLPGSNSPAWLQQNRVILENLNLIGCSWPNEMPLVHLLDQEANSGRSIDDQLQINCRHRLSSYGSQQQQQSNGPLGQWMVGLNIGNNNHSTTGYPHESVRLDASEIIEQQQQQQQHINNPILGVSTSSTQRASFGDVGVASIAGADAKDNNVQAASTTSIILASLLLLLLFASSIKFLVGLTGRLNELRKRNKRMGTSKWLTISTTTAPSGIIEDLKSSDFSITSSPISYQKTPTTTTTNELSSNANQSTQDALASSLMIQTSITNNIYDNDKNNNFIADYDDTRKHVNNNNNTNAVPYYYNHPQYYRENEMGNDKGLIGIEHENGHSNRGLPTMSSNGGRRLFMTTMRDTAVVNSSGSITDNSHPRPLDTFACGRSLSSKKGKEIISTTTTTVGAGWKGNLFSRLAERLSGPRRTGHSSGVSIANSIQDSNLIRWDCNKTPTLPTTTTAAAASNRLACAPNDVSFNVISPLVQDHHSMNPLNGAPLNKTLLLASPDGVHIYGDIRIVEQPMQAGALTKAIQYEVHPVVGCGKMGTFKRSQGSKFAISEDRADQIVTGDAFTQGIALNGPTSKKLNFVNEKQRDLVANSSYSRLEQKEESSREMQANGPLMTRSPGKFRGCSYGREQNLASNQRGETTAVSISGGSFTGPSKNSDLNGIGQFETCSVGSSCSISASPTLLSTNSADYEPGSSLVDGHIYVTLDRPIKQREQVNGTTTTTTAPPTTTTTTTTTTETPTADLDATVSVRDRHRQRKNFRLNSNDQGGKFVEGNCSNNNKCNYGSSSNVISTPSRRLDSTRFGGQEYGDSRVLHDSVIGDQGWPESSIERRVKDNKSFEWSNGTMIQNDGSMEESYDNPIRFVNVRDIKRG